jgi:hypothetical protein
MEAPFVLEISYRFVPRSACFAYIVITQISFAFAVQTPGVEVVFSMLQVDVSFFFSFFHCIRFEHLVAIATSASSFRISIAATPNTTNTPLWCG